MGQKVNPHGLRVGIIKGWNSRWFADNRHFSDYLIEDNKIRKFLKKKLFAAGISKIEIERTIDKIKIIINIAKPGIAIGKGGSEIEKIKFDIKKIIGTYNKIIIDIKEIKKQDKDAQLVSENIAAQLKARIPFRRAIKSAMSRAMKLDILGIKVSASGRLNGVDIARTESYSDGTIPLQTLRANIDYGFAESDTTYGKIGIKVWIYKGEILPLKRSKEGSSVDNVNAKKS